MSLYISSIARRQILVAVARVMGLALTAAAIGGVVLAAPSLANDPVSPGVIQPTV